MTRLVITADDVGLAAGMTRGALAAADRGIVTAVSVAAVGEAFDDAVAALGRVPHVDVGAHLVLVGERPLSPTSEVRSLTDREGRLLGGAAAFCARYARRAVVLAEVERELRRQLERLLGTPLRVRHLNSHQHLHALPGIFDIVVALAVEYGVPFVRIPADPQLPLFSTRAAALRALAACARRCRRRMPRGLAAVDGVVGLYHAGHLDRRRLREVLRPLGRALVPRDTLIRAAPLPAAGEVPAASVPVLELVCHPGEGDAALAARYPWGYAWEAERDALCDPELPAALAGQHIELTSFTELAAGR